MDRKKLLTILAYLIFFIFILHFAATKFYWYYSLWYLDIIMHFLGGIWIGLASIYIFQPKEFFFSTTLKILFVVLLVGIGWEIYEFLVNDTLAQNPMDFPDTFSDLFFDLFGGFCAILYTWSRTKSRAQENK